MTDLWNLPFNQWPPLAQYGLFIWSIAAIWACVDYLGKRK